MGGTSASPGKKNKAHRAVNTKYGRIPTSKTCTARLLNIKSARKRVQKKQHAFLRNTQYFKYLKRAHFMHTSAAHLHETCMAPCAIAHETAMIIHALCHSFAMHNQKHIQHPMLKKKTEPHNAALRLFYAITFMQLLNSSKCWRACAHLACAFRL
jgi:hypothetical protein